MTITAFHRQYDFLSNFHPSPILWNGLNYATVEHAFQAAKATDETDHEVIRVAGGPAMAKRLGRRVTRRDDWDTVKFDIMLELLRLKFAAGTKLARQLVSTYPHELIEGNTWNDTIWGVCNGRGENHLGRLLMQVRSELIYANWKPGQ